ncbi:hypothetical protein [Hymenobacter sediminicola]|uniref:Uncharacterized protein n=1 Tax=Hymenobacter sediminicola TaxID=2761579 RepID=A0A7G7W8C4_9BACT|nr:hypothetical protein [Hymenobacter sediminicola]QNH62617.1 hypothetical protein H4317_01975 [Hymenobacter sediminicola]
MKHLEYIKNSLKELEIEISNYPFKSEDWRTSYLELTYSSLEIYYRHWCSIYSSQIVSEQNLSKEQEKIVEDFKSTTKNMTLFYSTRNSFNRSLLTEAWSTFEFSLTYICEQLFDENIKNELLEEDFNDLMKLLSTYSISEQHLTKIKKNFSKKHLTHVPVTRKYNKIYSIFKHNHSGDIESDRRYLEFIGTYRNCIHTNYIYHGNNKEYSFHGTTYYFVNGEAVSHSKEPDITSMFDMAIELKNVCRRLFDSIDYPGLLEFPADKVIQP